jgi:long-chain acyl-CoA synthetase
VLNLATLLESSARDFPARDAVVLGPTRLTYAQVNGAANQVANALLERGLQPGDKVALTCPNVPYFPIVYYGILKAGGVVVPLNVLLKNREIAYHLRDSDARFYFCFQGTPELPMGLEGYAGFTEVDTCEHFVMITADPVAPSPIEGTTTLGQFMAAQSPLRDSASTDASDTAVILYTSGTTGQPKGAELSHANLVMNTVVCEKLFGAPPAGTHDVHLIALPLFHSFGQSVQLNTGFSMGATLVLLPRFDPVEALLTMDRESVTFFAGVPTMYWAMLSTGQTGADLAKVASNLRMAASGGASLPVEIIKTFQERFGVQILEGYGLSETSPVASFSRTDLEARPGSIGVPVWGVQMMLVDEEWKPAAGEVGEIAIRGHNVMKGYHGKPDATAEVMRDGWFRTGDVARRDEDGYYYIVDRAKDMIIRGGFNVYPREVEEVLMTHPAVSLAAVVGVKDEQYGEEVKAYVIKAPGATETEADLVEWAREQMAAHKYPRQVEFRESLPMNATGKILKRELR